MIIIEVKEGESLFDCKPQEGGGQGGEESKGSHWIIFLYFATIIQPIKQGLATSNTQHTYTQTCFIITNLMSPQYSTKAALLESGNYIKQN